MFRLDRMIATVTITLWTAVAAAESAPNADTPPAQPPTAQPTAPPTPAPAVPPQQAVPAPAPQAAPVPAPVTAQQGTPATVLDTQDYESVLGKGVRSANGDELGRIIDIIIDKDGRPRAAIIDFGGFLGVGSRKIAVDWRALRFTTDGKPGRLSLQLSRNQVRVSPEYKSGEPIVVLGPASPPAAEGEPQAAVPAAVQAPGALQSPAAVQAPAATQIPGAAPPAPAQSAPVQAPAPAAVPERAPD